VRAALILVTLLLSSCHLLQGSREREIVTVIKVKSTDCDVFIRKNFSQDDAGIESESTRPSKDERFLLDGWSKPNDRPE
jgi:hypothetical protein